MDVSDLRKRILRALEDARQESAGRGDAARRRQEKDAAREAYEQFLQRVAIPLLRQAQDILKAEGQPFTVHTPADGAKLVSDASPQTFVEFGLDLTADPAQVIGRVSHVRPRRGGVVEERPVVMGKGPADLTDEDVAAYLVTEIPKLVGRR
jgi:hypothetical protein